MNFDLHIHYHVSYDYEDFADAGYDQIAYYKDDELIILRDPTDNEVLALWEERCGDFDGEMWGGYIE